MKGFTVFALLALLSIIAANAYERELEEDVKRSFLRDLLREVEDLDMLKEDQKEVEIDKVAEMDRQQERGVADDDDDDDDDALAKKALSAMADLVAKLSGRS